MVQQLSPGDKLPNFALPDQAGATRNFYNEVKGGPILLAVCDGSEPAGGDAPLAALQAAAEGLAGEGAQLFGLIAGGPEAGAARAKRLGLGFPLFADAQGVAVPHLLAPAGANEAAAPARLYLLDPNQRILSILFFDEADAWLTTTRAALAAFRAGESAGLVLDCAPPVLILPRLFEPAFCAELIETWHSKGHREGSLSTGEGNVYAPDSKKNREHLVKDVEQNKRISFTLARRVGPELAKVFNDPRPFRFEGHIVLCYVDERRDFFALHRDNLRQTDRRRYAISLNLNDDFEGGELVFPEYGPHRYKPPAGAGLIFSGNLLHEALPVTRGTRFALVTFFCDADQPDARVPADRRRQMAV